MPKVACVTGANKGIGFAIVQLLCQQLVPTEDWTVLLAARSRERGESAVKALEAENLPIRPVYVQLDLTDKKQCEALRDHIKEKYGGLDLLVNNAVADACSASQLLQKKTKTWGSPSAVGYRSDSTVPLLEQVHKTLQTNYFATKAATEILLPVLRDNARVVNVASGEAVRGFQVMDPSLRQKMLSPDLTFEELDKFAYEFIDDAEKGRDRGTLTSYAFSKAALVAWTRRLADLAKQQRLPGLQAKNVLFVSCHPGWCKTDMAGWEKPPLSAAAGGAAVVDVCLNAKEEDNGEYFDEGVVKKLEEPSHSS